MTYLTDRTARRRANIRRIRAGRRLTLEALEERLTPSGETVSAVFSTVPVQKTVVATFDATIDSSLPKGIDRVFNQGSVSGSGFATIKTDDPFSPGGADPVVTLVDRAPTVAGVFLRSTSWNSTFLNNLQAQGLGNSTFGYSVASGAGQLLTVPWAGLDRISVRFSQNVNVTAGSLSVFGTFNPTYTLNAAGFSYDAATFTATWALTNALPADEFRIVLSATNLTAVTDGLRLDGEWLDGAAVYPSGNGTAGGDFSFRFNVVPGDVNRNTIANSVDLSLVRAGRGGNQTLLDVNGDGTVSDADVDLERSLVGKGLIPVAPGGTPGAGWVAAVTPTPPNPPGIPGTTVTARVEAFLVNDVDGDGRADPGDTLHYVVSIRNFGNAATSATLTDTLDPRMTLVANSLKLSPVAVDDAYTTQSNTPLVIPSATGVLANDVDPQSPPNLTVTDANTDNQFDQVTVGADGGFTFTPATGAKGVRTFQYIVRNASGLTSAGEVTVTVTNSPPVLANVGATPIAYTQGNPVTQVSSGITVTDSDDTQLAGATVFISSGFSSGDQLSFTNQLGINGNYNAATGVLQLSGNASLANYQTALRAVKYSNTAASPSTVTRTIAFVANDGAASNNFSTAVSRTVNFFAVHPSIAAPGGVVAGGAFSVTVTARDQNNAVAPGYIGTVHFSKTDSGAGSAVPADYTFVAGDNGVHTFTNGVTLVSAGLQSLTATDTVNAVITGTSNSITVNPAATQQLVVAGPASAVAGSPFNITVTAKDQFNNTTPAYTGTVHFTKSDGGTGSAVPANYSFIAGDNGVHTFTNGATLVTAGSQTVTATDTVTGSITGTTAGINVTAAAATHFSVSAPATATAGTAFSFTVTALDQFNNTATGYGGTVHFTSTDGQAVLPANGTLTNGTRTFSGTLKTVGNQTITGTDSVTTAVTGTSNSIAVSAASASHFAVMAPATATAGAAFNITVTALDPFSNVANSYLGTVHFTKSDSGVGSAVPADYTFVSGDNGVHTFSGGVTLVTAGPQTFTATDTVTSSITGTSNTITVSPQLALGGQGPGGPGVTPLTMDQLRPILAEAEDRWAAVGLSPADLARLRAVTASVADLPDGWLGAAPLWGNTISVDVTGAGYGWFIDPTPADDSEFGPSAAASPAAGRTDLLTVVMHELGHVIGLDTRFGGDRSDLMYAYLGNGTRRLPNIADLGDRAAAPISVTSNAGDGDTSPRVRWTPEPASRDSASEGSGGSSVQVKNVAPTASLSSPNNGVPGQPRTFTFSAVDVSPTDQSAGFSYTINWGDGAAQTIARTAGNGRALAVDHVYTTTGSFTAQLTATDKDGATSVASMQPNRVQVVQMQGTDLAVGGTTGTDSISISPANAAGDLAVTVNKLSYPASETPALHPTGHILCLRPGGCERHRPARQ
jgi:hypothetical protein